LEKREYERKEFNQSFSFEISIAGDQFENVTHEAIGIDISSYGLGMVTNYALKEGSVLKSHIPLSEMDTTLPVYVLVIWSKPANDKFRAGLRFLH
jgi:hypothetical protein